MAKSFWLTMGGVMLLAPAMALCQGYPSKPIRIIVPFAPGGNIDITARTIAPGLSAALGQTVIVENRAGAGGSIGATNVAKSAPDGYTVLLGAPGTLVSQPIFRGGVEYDTLRDFVYTSRISLVASALSVHPSTGSTGATSPARPSPSTRRCATARPLRRRRATPSHCRNRPCPPESKDPS